MSISYFTTQPLLRRTESTSPPDEGEWTLTTVRAMAAAPTLRSVTAEVRGLNSRFEGPGEVGISSGGRVLYQDGLGDMSGCLAGLELLPGDGRPVDAVAVARRLLAAWRDAWPTAARGTK